MNRKKLAKGLERATSAREFIEALYGALHKLARYSVEWEGDRPARMVLFGEDFNREVAEMLLAHRKLPNVFESVKELRVVATRIPREQAEQFRQFNSQMRVVWVSSEEWIRRPKGAPNPVDLAVPV